MKKIKENEQKQILVDLLKYVDDICRKNNIKYSLLGGSLIGAIRHDGIIPWDDDIDIVLLPDDYNKLIAVLSIEHEKYCLLSSANDSYPYPFSKLVDKRTVLHEKGMEKIENYGIYLDIFEYHYVPNNPCLRLFHYLRLGLIKKMLCISMLDYSELRKSNHLGKKIVFPFTRLISTKRLRDHYIKSCKNVSKSDYVLSNWQAYGYKKEIQLADSFVSFSNHKFENIEAMICDGYDDVLRTTFGEYMKLPPLEKQCSNHNTIVYWRNSHGKK